MNETALSKLAKAIKSKEALLIGVVILAIVGVVVYIVFSNQTKAVGWKDKIFPGKTTKAQLVKLLGEPFRIENKNNEVIYDYHSGSFYRPNQVVLENNKVVLVMEQVLDNEKGTLNDYTTKYGPVESVIYSSKYGAIAPAYFWGSRGFLVFASQDGKSLSEIWYFPATNVDIFLQQNPSFSSVAPVTP